MTEHSSKSASKTVGTPLTLLLCMSIGYGWVAWQNAVANAAEKYPVLSACSQESYKTLFDSDYASLVQSLPSEIDVNDIPDIVDFWSSLYHYNVDEMVTYHVGGNTSVPEYEQAVKCEEENEGASYPPGPIMTQVAMQLPPWKDATDFAQLSESDIGAVLLEYLAGYECALWERRFYLSTKVIVDEFKLRDFLTIPRLNTWNVLEEIADQRAKIDRELITARKAANRTLVYLSGYSRLGQLDRELQCLQRASLDLRNVLAVMAETSSCLPRIWSAKDPLRDIFDYTE